jgi:hypothetical protein
MTHSYLYHRIEHAYYARNAEIKASAQGRASAAVVCQTLDEFIVKPIGDDCSIDNAYLAAGNTWLRRQLRAPVRLDDRPFVVGRRPVAGEGLPRRQPDLRLHDIPPFRLSRNHFMIEQRHEGYHVRDLHSTLGTIVNGQPIGGYLRTDDLLLRTGENEVIAGGVDSPFVFSVSIPGSPALSPLRNTRGPRSEPLPSLEKSQRWRCRALHGRASIGACRSGGVRTDAPLSLDRAHKRPVPGYWRDHIAPLACGGPDGVSNMQRQPIRDARAKNAWERRACTR